jgi:hypothetical protein
MEDKVEEQTQSSGRSLTIKVVRLPNPLVITYESFLNPWL